MANEWDTVIKLLVGSNPQHFVSLLLPGARFHGIVDKELTPRTIEADLLYTVEWREQLIVLHVEFQRRRDGDMGKRMWEYNFLSTYQTQLPVCSFVVYLMPDGNVPESPYVQRLLDEEAIHIFYYRVIKLWEIKSEAVKQPGLEGMLPLLPLTRDGIRRERIEEMITRLQDAGREDLLAMAYSLAALAFKKTEDKAWLQRRFDMLKDILEESWAYQEMVQSAKTQGLKEGMREGREEGIKEGMKEGMKEGLNALRTTFLGFVQKRYPQLVPLATQYVNQVIEPNVLSDTMNKLFDAQSSEEAAQILTLM